MFNKLINLKRHSKETISINKLVDIVKNNPQSDLISKIRSVEYKSTEYNNLKLKVNAITPHGVFSNLKKDGLIKLSKYFYYDVDGFDTINNLNDTINNLIDTNMVCFICKSVGGMGISFMVKIDDTEINLNDTNFINVYSYVRDLFIQKGFNIDKAAGGLVRKMIISSDDNVYFNNKVSLRINKVSFNKWLNDLEDLMVIKRKQRDKSGGDINLNDTLIEYDKLLKTIKLETEYKNIDNNYSIDKIDYYKIIIPKHIKDGDKHKLYARIVNALYYINNNITRQEVYSFIYHINKEADNKMNSYNLNRYINYLCNTIESNGEIRLKVRKKTIHFNKELKLTKKQKESMGGKIGSKIKQNKSIKLIQDARDECAKQNIIPTRKRIAEMTGLGIATVKRNWNKEVNDINNIEVPLETKYEDIKEERDYKLKQLTQIEEDLFWENWQPKKVSQDKDEIVDKDWGESDGIPGFIETI